MYNETYEDYIRSILGYPNYSSTTNDCIANTYQPMMNENSNQQTKELESCYPEIYKVVYPMVNKACNTNTRPITPELIDELTNEIYLSIENDNEINVTINLNNKINTNENRSINSNVANGNRTNTSSMNGMATVNKTQKPQENRGEDRKFKNRGLQDLIRVLLIRELLGRPNRPRNRPPMPPQGRPPMRTPFLPLVGELGGPRPPIMPRDVNSFSDLYEN